MRRAGISLAETILAWGLLGTLLVLAVCLMPSCVQAYRSVTQQAQAETFAQSWISAREAENYGALRIGPTPSEPVLTARGTEYRMRGQVLEEPGFTPAQALRVRVTVEWTDRHNKRALVREVSLHAPL